MRGLSAVVYLPRVQPTAGRDRNGNSFMVQCIAEIQLKGKMSLLLQKSKGAIRIAALDRVGNGIFFTVRSL